MFTIPHACCIDVGDVGVDLTFGSRGKATKGIKDLLMQYQDNFVNVGLSDTDTEKKPTLKSDDSDYRNDNNYLDVDEKVSTK